MASLPALLSPSIQLSFPHLAKFCPAIGSKQFLYSLMVITAYRGKTHITNLKIWKVSGKPCVAYAFED